MNLGRHLLRVLLAGLTAFGSIHATPALAQDWPKRPVRWVVPFPPGAIADAGGRLLAQKLTEKWGQQVLVDNKPGGVSVVGTTEVAQAPADGYTLLQALDFTWTMNPFMFAKLPYDPLRDFTHITQLARVPLVIVANDKVAASSVAELVALAKRQPGTIAVGGVGPIVQIAVEKFSRDAQVKLLYVPYKGGADVARGMLSGEIAVGFDGVATFLPFLKSGRLRALATTGVQRAAALPDVPALAELGLPNASFYAWHSLSAPAGLARDIQQKIQADVRSVLTSPDVRERLLALGLEPIGSTSDEFVDAVKRESQSSSAIIRELGLRLD